MKTYLYVDVENIGLAGITPLMHVDIPNLTIYFIYTNVSVAIPFSQVHLFSESKHKLKYVFAQNGEKNAADFVLVAELTRQVISAPKSLHLVYSRDRGFISAVKHLRSIDKNIAVCSGDTSTIDMAYSDCLNKPVMKERYMT